ncbi:MAG: methyltransferase [Cyclobacteriaceae bacterium]|nr:methyltransferase [Cyclobacteriaceae bacterium]
MENQTNTVEKKITPSQIMQVGVGFFASKTLLTAVKLELFTHLSLCPLSGEEIKGKLGLQSRGLYDFLDTLVSLSFLNREGLRDEAFYSNTEETDLFLDKSKPSYIGGILEMANNRLYKFWDNLDDALITGQPQNEIKHTGVSLFDELYKDSQKLREFMMAMQGAQMGAFIELASQFNFKKYNTLCDIGGASAALSIQVAQKNPHMKCISADLPVVRAIAQENIERFKLQGNVSTVNLDFFEESAFPKSDVITMGNILHDWGLHDKKMLMKKAYNALPEGGALVIVENVIDNDRSKNTFGLLMSLNMLIETLEGFDFTASDFEGWAKGIGFSKVEMMPLAGPTSAVIAIK